jgi:hypothetical protein
MAACETGAKTGASLAREGVGPSRAEQDGAGREAREHGRSRPAPEGEQRGVEGEPGRGEGNEREQKGSVEDDSGRGKAAGD